MTRFYDLEKALANDLAGAQKLVLPASGSLFYKDPVINWEGDLVASVGWNGNDDGGGSGGGDANPTATDRKVVPRYWEDARPTQPVKVTS